MILAFLEKKKLASRIKAQPVFDAFRASLPKELSEAVRPVKFASQTLEVFVTSATQLHELRHFHTEKILENIRKLVPQAPIRNIRYRLAAEMTTEQ
ncbi:MAG: DUF721 domain-containing protein [Planctomycetes bacterium]|nr:DUF721 domain-containing protein [Planctomycetota bacterium]